MTSSNDLLTIEEYSADEFEQLSWEQYGKILDLLGASIEKYTKENDITFDAIVPVLRGGMVVATAMAGRFKVLRILPVQYKYFIDGKKVFLNRLLPLPKDITLPDSPKILITENCYCFGTTTKAAVQDVRALYPSARIYVAADRMDYTYKNIEDVEQVFYGELNNDTKKLSLDECSQIGINPLQYYYPWESLDEEIAACQLKQYNYADLNETRQDGEIVEQWDFS
jgi:hypoxanthine phosphoribosyltransferase